MHSHQLHRHPARQHQKRVDATLENNDSLANIVERAEVEEDDGVATLYSVVYVTASATFSGPTAGYVTVGLSSTSSAKAAKSTAADADNDKTTTSATAKHTTSTKSTAAASDKAATTSKTVSSASSAASNKSASHTTLSTKSATSNESTSSVSSTTTSSVQSSSLVATSSVELTSSSSALSGTALAQATVSSSASASASSSSAASTGLSSGAKGGIAFAVLLCIALVAGLGLLFNRRRKNQQKAIAGAQRLADDEKRAPPPPPVINTPPPAVVERTSSPAPRLSIRPTSRFSLGADPEKAAAGIAAAGAGGQKASVWERPGATRWPTTPTRANVNSTTDPANPFGIHAETVNNSPPPAEKVISPTPMLNASMSTASFELQGSPVPPTPTTSTPAVIVNPPAEEATQPEEATSPSTEPSSPSEMISPSVEVMSPTKAEFGTASAVPVIAAAGAVAGAGVASGPAPGENVHRVQLEFKPSMDDELGLTPGQLVRLLHEYDDGWALCMNMDRSKQGVAPRSCVSKLPLKQRPVGPPPNGPMSPMRGPAPLSQGGRKVSGPPGPRGAMAPKPLSPAVNARMFPPGPPRQRTQSSGVGAPIAPRSMSPGPNPSKSMADTRSRSASVGAGDASKPVNAAGPSSPSVGAVPSRKPVPGQAL